VPGIRNPLMINGVPVVTAPAEIDITTAEQLRVVLLRSAARRQPTIVVDMTRTQFCDSTGLTVLVRAHTQMLADGGELRLVIPDGGTLASIFTSTSLDRLIPLFGSLDKALASRPPIVIRPFRPRPPAACRLARQPRGPGRRV
jgi:anti-sigma B factor antagonist